jgi:hypothetical protein
MKFNSKINHSILSESKHDCTMFWCIPLPQDDHYKWDVISFNSKGDDLSNWLIVLFQLKRAWKKDFSRLREHHNCLPRGIVYDKFLYHGNNLPISLFNVAKGLKINLGDEYESVYNNAYGISSKGLAEINNVLGLEIDLPTTDI